MKLVEIINTNYTDKQITESVTELAQRMGEKFQLFVRILPVLS